MTPTEFKAIFPEFTTTLDAMVQAALDAADPFFDSVRWDSLLSSGLSSYVAHELTMSGVTSATPNGTSGIDNSAVATEVRDIKERFDAQSIRDQGENPYMRTIYGQKYYRLAKLVGAGAVAV
jgi:hypothetical protein